MSNITITIEFSYLKLIWLQISQLLLNGLSLLFNLNNEDEAFELSKYLFMLYKYIGLHVVSFIKYFINVFFFNG